MGNTHNHLSRIPYYKYSNKAKGAMQAIHNKVNNFTAGRGLVQCSSPDLKCIFSYLFLYSRNYSALNNILDFSDCHLFASDFQIFRTSYLVYIKFTIFSKFSKNIPCMQIKVKFLAPAVTVGETEGAMDSASVLFLPLLLPITLYENKLG